MNVTDILLGSAKEVAKNLGPGYSEATYEEALMHEFRLRKIPYERQRRIEILYKNHSIGERRPDCIMYPLWSGSKTEFLVEMKTANKISEDHIKQGQVYLNSLNIPAGVILNFNKKDATPEIEMIKPTRASTEEAKIPKLSKPKGLESALSIAAKNVLSILGTEFIYNPTNVYPNAVAVELRLMGFEPGTRSYSILYKSQKVEEYEYDFAFKDGEVVKLGFYKNKEDAKDEIRQLKNYGQLFGVKKCYLLSLPKDKGGEAFVVQI